MSPIDKVGALQRILRHALMEQADKRPTKRTLKSESSAATSIQQHIAAGLAEIAPVDPDSVPRALTVYVRVILTKEFGQNVANDPDFANLLADVVDTIQLTPQFNELANFLKQQLANQPKSHE